MTTTLSYKLPARHQSLPPQAFVTLMDILRSGSDPWKLARQLALYVWQAPQRWKRNPVAVAGTCLVLLTGVIGLRIAGLDVFAFLPSYNVLPDAVLNLPVIRTAASTYDTRQIGLCASKARAVSQKYLIVSLTEFHHVEGDFYHSRRTIKQRMAYTILPFADIGYDQDGFDENFATDGESTN